MRRIIAGALLAALLSAMAAHAEAAKQRDAITYAGGDGRGCERAVEIRGASSAPAGMAAQKAWLARNHPTARWTESAIRRRGGKTFDVIALAEPGGGTLLICFDVSAFFGRW